MACPLGPTLANFSMAHMENQLLCDDPESSPKLYLRYIIDIFSIFDNDQSCTKFLDKLNIQHPNIEFTLEQTKIQYHFWMRKLFDKFDTWTRRKHSITELLLNFNAFVSQNLEKRSYFCLLNRAKTICSTD